METHNTLCGCGYTQIYLEHISGWNSVNIHTNNVRRMNNSDVITLLSADIETILSTVDNTTFGK